MRARSLYRKMSAHPLLETFVTEQTATGRPTQIASGKHLLRFLGIMAAIAVGSFYLQRAGSSAGGTADPGVVLQTYVSALFLEGLLFYLSWAGVRAYGGNLAVLTGGRWTSWRGVVTDLAIALPFWLVCEGVTRLLELPHLLGSGDSKLVGSLLPHGPIQIALWIVLSMAAGFCEEVAFRGYLQRQLHAFTGSRVVAVLGQAVVFGLLHAYQGGRQVLEIIVVGVLFGLLAAWRGNLRANVLAHAWTDLWGGWLKSALLR